MEFIKPGINIDFIGRRKIAFALSLVLIALTVIVLVWRGGPNYGVDFSGGVLIQIKLDQPKSPAEIRDAFESPILKESIIQEFGDESEAEYLIRVRQPEAELADLNERAQEALTQAFGQGVEIRRVEMVGPKVGEDLRQKALFAIFYAILFIAIYISGRFELKWAMSMIMALSLAVVVYAASTLGVSVTWLIILALLVTLALCWFLRLKYAMGALVALIHDVTIVVGAFALTNREISLATIAAFLTIVGYSLNDTIVVFDRIRENTRRFRRKNFEEVMNTSINETLSRTILTSTTTLIVVVALFVLGGGVIHDFAFALLVGVLVGSYSSVFVASPILLAWQDRFSGAKKAGRKKAGA
ncbi:MAG: protein translocase subunit SecF [Desulfobacteraceae bacterium]